MIIINYLHIGFDDTDSPDGMCTTYLACKIIDKLKQENIVIIDYPRLIRLNPFARFKTRGNGAVYFKILNENSKLVKEIIIKEIEELSEMDCENTNPGVVFYEGEITKEMIDFSYKAINSIITIKEAETLADKIGGEIHKFKKGRGIIGSLAAIGMPLEDYTYELLVYRSKENYGTKRNIDYESVLKMDKETFPDTFENYDVKEKYIAIEPKTPCPVLYGIRANNVEALKKAKKIVKVLEPIESSCIFKTNQHTDVHIQKTNNILEMKQYSCYKVKGEVKNKAKIIEGGHMFFYIFDVAGEIECGAYEPTKQFRETISKLLPGDIVELYGGIGKRNTFNIEKFKIIKLNDVKFENPICCNKKMSSAGKNKGFKCKKCGNKIKSDEKVQVKVKRDLIQGKFYETPVSARRHLAKPLCRMNIDN